MMIMLILLVTMILVNLARANDCNKHPIFCQIVKNKKNIDKEYALKLSNVIYKVSKDYHIPPRLFTAILMQESGYTLATTHKYKGLRKLTGPEARAEVIMCRINNTTKKDILIYDKYIYCLENIKKFKETIVITDFGISQIWYKTAKAFDFDVKLLITDLKYSVKAGAIVLADFKKRYESRENDWWTRYNCGNKGNTTRDTCQFYKKLVERYL